MSSKVFISYAGRDPQWPEATVWALGEELERQGATVWLDQFHLSRQPVPGKLAASEWRDWMTQALDEADRVVCLVSERYAQAARRSLDEPWGYGVAYESLKVIGRMYRKKGRNDKWILTVRPDLTTFDLIPEDLQESCPDYQWPSERQGVLEHACMRPLGVDGSHRLRAEGSDDGKESDAAAGEARRHARLTIRRLSAPEAAQFLQALQADLRDETDLPAWATAPVDAFVQGVAMAAPGEAREVMLAIRRVLKEAEGKPSDAVCRAAVALSMLCACRWVARVPAVVVGRVVKAPSLQRHALAVLSAAMFGGEVMLVSDGVGGSAPMHLYDACPPTSEDRRPTLLGAIYEKVCWQEMDATAVAQKDRFTDAEHKRVMGKLIVRLEDVRKVVKSSFTLVVSERDAEAWETADWSPDIAVSPFTVDTALSQDLFAMPPEELEAMVSELWRLIQPTSTG